MLLFFKSQIHVLTSLSISYGVQRVYAPPDIVRVGQNVPQLRSDNRKMLTSELGECLFVN